MFPEQMDRLYNERKAIKKTMLQHEQNVVDAEEEMKRRGLI
jgi:hypothetical protein